MMRAAAAALALCLAAWPASAEPAKLILRDADGDRAGSITQGLGGKLIVRDRDGDRAGSSRQGSVAS